MFPIIEFTFRHGSSGGPDLAAAPANTFISNRNYGLVVNTHAVGHYDFMDKDNIKILFWF